MAETVMKLQDKIAYQLDVSDGGTIDATAISLTRVEIPSGVISVTTDTFTRRLRSCRLRTWGPAPI